MRIKRSLTSNRTTEKADPQANGPRMRADRNDPQLGGHDPLGLSSIGLRLEADQHLRVGVPIGLQHGAPLSCNIGPKGGEARPPVLNHHLFGKLLAEAVGPAALKDDSSDDKLLRRRRPRSQSRGQPAGTLAGRRRQKRRAPWDTRPRPPPHCRGGRGVRPPPLGRRSWRLARGQAGFRYRRRATRNLLLLLLVLGEGEAGRAGEGGEGDR
jgi:hypothetical protein